MQLRLSTACAVAALAFTAAPAVPAAARTVVVATVGETSSCQFDELQDAIDALSALPADRRVIQVEDGDRFENLSLNVATEQIEIVGGFPSCSASAPGGSRTRLLGSALDRLLDIGPGPAPRSFVRLANLVLEGGEAERGGGIRITGPVDVVLENTLVLGNAANQGGGIHLSAAEMLASDGAEQVTGVAGPTLALLDGSGVNGNRAVSGEGQPRGGGIHCDGGGRITGGGGSGVVANEVEADGAGGGLYLTECELSLTGPFTVAGNRAHDGGGIFGFQSRVELRGTAAGQVRVINNTAKADSSVAGSGGGIMVRGAQAELIAENTRIDDNRALPEGGGSLAGGLAVQQGALARLDRTLGPSCPGGVACSSLSGNRADDGAAARISQGGRLELRRTAVHENVAGGSVALVTPGQGFGTSRILVEGSTLTANAGVSLFSIEDDARLQVRFSSAAGNPGLSEVIRGSVSPGAPSGEVELVNSILYETAPGTELIDLSPQIALQAACMVVPERSGLPPAAVATTADPQFVDPGQGDLHLAPTSPALDACPGFAGAPASDLDLDVRGHDLPAVPDRVPGAVFDAGADEIGPPAPIFADGFETGDTSAWTAATPG